MRGAGGTPSRLEELPCLRTRLPPFPLTPKLAPHHPGWQKGISEIGRVLKPDGTFFFEEVTRAALERWIYRRFFEHPAENRFSEAEFMTKLESHGMKPAGP